MGRSRLILHLCWIAVICAATCTAAAQASPPRWYGHEAGSGIPLNGQAGLVEPQSPETLQSVGELRVFGKGQKPSECLAKAHEDISNPQNKSLPGTGEMDEFELLCEKSTGFGNYAEPYPCAFGEPFELKGVGLNWPSTLEAEEPANQRKYLHYYDKFTHVAIEVDCLRSKELDRYTGSLRPEVDIGRFNYRGTESGELEDAGGHHLSMKGFENNAPSKYKDIRVRADYEERLEITSLSPTAGPAVGGTTVTVEGTGLGLGAATTFNFGEASGTAVNCMLTTECTVVSPPEKAGVVRVIATVGSVKSQKNNAGNRYTYE